MNMSLISLTHFLLILHNIGYLMYCMYVLGNKMVSLNAVMYHSHWQVDLTTWTGFFCILAIVLLVTSITTTVVLINKYVSGWKG